MFFADTAPRLRQDLELRRERMAALLREIGADALLITGNVSLYHATARVCDGYFYMEAGGRCLLFLRRPHAWVGCGIVPIKHPAEIPALLRDRGWPVPRRVMLEEDLPHAEYRLLAGLFEGEPLPSVMRRARTIKSPMERDFIRSAGAWQAEAYHAVPGLYRPGMTDRDFEVAISKHFLDLGHPGMFRMAGHRMQAVIGTILAGPNADEPSPFDFALGGAGRRHLPFSAAGIPMARGTTVLVDMSGSYEGYLSDLSRVYAIGELPPEAYAMHEVALEIQAAVTQAATPGTRCCDLYQLGLDIAQKSGFGAHFMGYTQQAKFIGHGLGTEINEPPVLTPKDTTPLEPGMVFALEPKFVLPGVGAVGIENTFIVTSGRPERVTPGEDAIVSLEG